MVGVAIVAVFAIAVLVDGENLVARFRRLLKPERREQADEVGRVVYATLGRYIGGSLTVALLMGIFVLTVGLILGVPLAPLAAVWAMITDLIPQVGGALGGVVFVALALTESVPTALIAGGLFVAYMTFENHVIQPAIVGRSVDLTPPTTMVAAFVGGAVAGVPGALLATPLVGAAKQLILEARRSSPDAAAAIQGRAGGRGVVAGQRGRRNDPVALSVAEPSAPIVTVTSPRPRAPSNRPSPPVILNRPSKTNPPAPSAHSVPSATWPMLWSGPSPSSPA